MRFKAKILWILLGVCLLLVLVGARAISRQRAVGILEASSEAEEDARVLAFIVAADHDPAHAISEKVSRYMYETLGRDVEVVDTHKRVIADAIPAEVGGMSDHGGDALDQTLRDGRVRTSFETNPARPRGMRLIMAPVTTESGQVAGAVTEEYTPIYNEFMAITEATTRQVVYAALAGVVVSVLLALYIGRSIAAPLRQLTGAAVGFAAGQTGLSLPPSRNDEIGDLTVAFNVMMERRQQAQEALVQARDELGQANAQLQIEVSERRLAEETARQGEVRVRKMAKDMAHERMRLTDILDNVPAMVFENWSLGSAESDRSFMSRHVERMLGYTPTEWFSRPDFWALAVHPDDRESALAHARAMFAGDHNGGQENWKMVFRWLTKDNRIVWGETHLAAVRNPADGTEGVRGFTVDVTERKEAEQKLAELNGQLLASSRAAGMAEVATNVLHNVGNVLTSVNISATLAAEYLRQSSVSHLGRAIALLRENAGDLGAYLTIDPVGRKLPAFLLQLTGQLEAENSAILGELEQLAKNVEHIKDIVSVQQSYASSAGMSQTVAVVEMVEDSLRMNAGALSRHEVQLIREFEIQPVIQVDKHKVMQILVNLIRNAKYACDESGRPDKRLTVRISDGDGIIRISVIDNGVGILAENLTRIFSHGFTTRKEGHGFGLHSSALAAREMGGALLAQSDGQGLGAVFTLELPFESSKLS